MSTASSSLLLLILMFMTGSVAAEDGHHLHFYTEEYPPFSFSKNGEIRGINTELIEAVAGELGLDAEFAVVPWGRAQMLTQTRPNTCFFSAARTQARETLYQWVGPLTRERIQLFSLNPHGPVLETFKDGKDYRVGGQIADAYSDWVEEQGITVERVTEVGANLVKLEWGRIDLWLAGSIAGPYIAAQADMEVYPMATSDEVFELWLACSQDLPKTLIEGMNQELHTLQADGTLDGIMARYH